MTTEQKKKRDPLFHVSKLDTMPTWKSLAIRIGAILVALLICGIMSVILIKKDPIRIYSALFTGAFIDVWTLLEDTAILLIFGLAVIPAFKMKYWNMGANGQVLIGCLAGIACMRFLTGVLPSPVISVIIIVASVLAAIVWAVIPAIFKAFFNTNETLFTLMMNYIAVALVNYFVFVWDPKQGNIGIVNSAKDTEAYQVGWFPAIGNDYLLPIVVSLILVGLVYVYMRYTKHGFEVELVGESVNTARYVGINVKKVVIRTLIFSGAIAGVMGALYAGAISHTVNGTVGGEGFTAILVAWLANFNPLIMILTSFFVVFLNTGAENVSTKFHLNSNDYADIIVGIVFFCVIGCEFFIRYKVQLSPHYKEKFDKLFHKKQASENGKEEA